MAEGSESVETTGPVHSGQSPDKRYGIPVVPEPVHAALGGLAPSTDRIHTPGSVADLIGMVGRDVAFWRPGIADMARALGWRWLIMVPALLVLGLPLAAIIFTTHQSPFFVMAFSWFKLWLLDLGVIVTLVGWAIRNAIKVRKGAFCIHCGYDLESRPTSGVCPECGRAYIPGIWREYAKDPGFFVRRYREIAKHPKGATLEITSDLGRGGNGGA